MGHGRLLLTVLVGLAGAGGIGAATQAAQDTAAPLLPDLVQEPPYDLKVQRAAGRYRLGFGSAVSNTGAGELRIVASRPSPHRLDMSANQVVTLADGTQLVQPRVGALRYTRSPGHAHWHYLGFDRYTLRRASDRRVVVRDRKTGFCLGDRYETEQPKEISGMPTYETRCGLGRPDLLNIVEGITSGHGDDYDAYLEGQHLDVTDLPAGRYELVHHVNADRRLLEERFDNNTACAGLRLSWPRGRRASPSIRRTTCRP